MDAAVAFAKVATTLKYEDIPQPAREMTKKDILDTLGTALAGSTAEGSAELVKLVKEELGGKPKSSVIAYGVKVPSPEAALVNGFMARSVDYDDTYDIALLHAGSSIVPAALAAAEHKGAVTGKEFITAVALGIDMMCRMGLARQEPLSVGWLSSPLYGHFGAALTAARLLGLNQEQTINALGIAYGQAGGNSASTRERVLTKNLDIGCAARAGVFSALVARKGITGAHGCLEGDRGLFKVYHRGNYDPKQLTDELGKRFEVVNISFKPYPCARPNHPFIDLALAARQEHNIKPEDIEEVVGYIGEEPHVEFHPVKDKQNPKSVTDTQFSIPYAVAVALVKGAVLLDDFTESALKDTRVTTLAQKVVPKLDRSLYRGTELPPAILEIKTKAGTYSKRIEYPYGHPKNPMTMESLDRKFRDCASHAHKRLPERKISAVVDMVMKLEELSDIAEVIKLLR